MISPEQGNALMSQIAEMCDHDPNTILTVCLDLTTSFIDVFMVDAPAEAKREIAEGLGASLLASITREDADVRKQ